ncbi:hypothetical protein HJFPF1_02220 [Paramyrothecium foliicola]|nr:hypothetical protein HJFPF1_02220 [Paramyrothecium foliicola]
MAETTSFRQDVSASIWFLRRLELYATVKPYSLAFTPSISIPRENIEREEVSVQISDMRGREGEFNIGLNGFMILNLSQEPPSINWDDEQCVERDYYHLAAAQIENALPGYKCVPLSHKIRKRDTNFPMSTGQDYAYGQPLRAAHVDMTRSSAEQLIQERLKEPGLQIMKNKYFIAK